MHWSEPIASAFSDASVITNQLEACVKALADVSELANAAKTRIGRSLSMSLAHLLLARVS